MYLPKILMRSPNYGLFCGDIVVYFSGPGSQARAWHYAAVQLSNRAEVAAPSPGKVLRPICMCLDVRFVLFGWPGWHWGLLVQEELTVEFSRAVSSSTRCAATQLFVRKNAAAGVGPRPIAWRRPVAE